MGTFRIIAICALVTGVVGYTACGSDETADTTAGSTGGSTAGSGGDTSSSSTGGTGGAGAATTGGAGGVGGAQGGAPPAGGPCSSNLCDDQAPNNGCTNCLEDDCSATHAACLADDGSGGAGGTGGAGGAGGSTSCVACADALGGEDVGSLCTASATLYQALRSCACGDGAGGGGGVGGDAGGLCGAN